jgi:hypothetical protein
VRFHPVEFAPVLRTVLGALAVEAADVDPNYSMRFRPAGQERSGAHVLFAGCETLARSRAPRRVVTALLRFLDGRAMEADGRYLQLDATAVVSEGRAIILPARLRSQLAAAEDELITRGLGQIDGPVLFDPEHADIVVPPLPAIPQTDPPLRDPPGPATPEVGAGRFEVQAWAWHTRTDGRRASPGQRTAQAGMLVRNLGAAGTQRALEAVARSTSTATCWLPAGRTPTPQLLDLLTHQHWS